MSSAYHPQTNGQTERVNQCLETFLRCFMHSCPTKWSSWLPTAKFWYNTTFHSSVGRSPFEAMYGTHPRILGLVPPAAAESNLDTWLTERANMTQLIQHHLSRAQHRIKKQADKHRS
jgi:hypothetical protein